MRLFLLSKYPSKLQNRQLNSYSEDGCLHSKTMRMAENVNLETVIYKWFIPIHGRGQPKRSPLICEKACFSTNVQLPKPTSTAMNCIGLLYLTNWNTGCVWGILYLVFSLT